MEGIVFWKDGKPCCKIKRRDFGFKWPCKEKDIQDYVAQNNKKLIERFPFLLPGYGKNEDGSISSDFDYSFTKLDSMPTGWRIAFGEKMCEEIKEALYLHTLQKQNMRQPCVIIVFLKSKRNTVSCAGMTVAV